MWPFATKFGKLGIFSSFLPNVIAGGDGPGRVTPMHDIEVGSLLCAISEPAILIDEGGTIAEVNHAAENLLRRSRQHLIGSPAEKLLTQLMGEPLDRAQTALTKAMRGGHIQGRRQAVDGQDGEPLLLKTSINPICNTAGHQAGVLLTIQDLTEVDRLRSELEHGERHLAMGEMTASLVHDFSNELSTISEAVTALEMGRNSSEHDRVVFGILRNAVRHGGETLGNIRKYLSGKGSEASRVDVRQLLNEVLELANPVLNTHTQITVVRDTHACGEVKANSDELRRAFTNLVLNSLQAMPDRGTLTVSCRPLSGRVLVTVRDTGGGIPPEVQRRLFSSYFTTKAKGTGLGLAGARRTIEAVGGDIRFETAAGRGTTFYVSLPVINGTGCCVTSNSLERNVS
ncbi:MAG TPA: ATP-binding protein [Terriglobales bacterium]|nr:ATP-binding protein [Terriglobales bacterium]